jgi:hypothetical protein
MKAVERKVSASRDGKRLFITINKKKLSIPWNESYFYQGDRVLVSAEKMQEKTIYCIQPSDQRLRKNETHWKEIPNGVSSETIG